jgi:hypothetical protein
LVGGRGVGRTGGGGAVAAVACAPKAPGGVCGRPTNAWGAGERWRLGCAGAGGVGGPGLAPVPCHMTKSHTRAKKASGEKKRGETLAWPPP